MNYDIGVHVNILKKRYYVKVINSTQTLLSWVPLLNYWSTVASKLL
jgi:hypothetical protein